MSAQHSLEKLLNRKIISEEERNSLYEKFTDYYYYSNSYNRNIEEINFMAAKYLFAFPKSKMKKNEFNSEWLYNS